MVNTERVQISDISDKADGTNVTISGMVINKYRPKRSEKTLIATVKDFSGTINVFVQLSETLPQSLFWKQTILQLTGTVATNNEGKKY